MRGLVTAALLFWAAAPASAQDTEYDTGSHIAVPRRARIEDSARPDKEVAQIAMAEFAKCVMARDPKGVARALSLEIGPQYFKQMSYLATDECLANGGLKIPQIIMRGAIFVEVYRLYDTKKQALVQTRPLDFSNPASPKYKNDSTRYALLSFADCVVKRDEAGARAVVLAPVATRAENVAFKAIMPSLGACLSSGQKASFSRPVLGGVLAEVLYRDAVAPPPPAAAGAK